MHRYKLNFQLSEKHFSDTIPITFEDGQVYFPVTVGSRTYRMNLDTGSGQGTLSAWSRLPVERELGRVVSRDANHRTDTVRAVTVAPMRIGRLTVTGYVASVVRPKMRSGKYDGILGFDFFNKGIAVKIDVRAGQMILTDRKDLFDGEEGFPLKYKLKWFVPHVLVSPFIRHVDEALFDTGARPLYEINKEQFDEHAYKSKQVNAQVESRTRGQLSIGLHGAEHKDVVAFLRLDRLKWGDYEFRNYRTVTTQGASRIGAELLHYGSVIINPWKKVITFQPYDNPEYTVIDNLGFNMAFVPKDGRAVVGLIRDDCEAYRKGMRQGDIILKIDGKPIPSFDAFTRFPFVKNREHTFTLSDAEGKVKEVTCRR